MGHHRRDPGRPGVPQRDTAHRHVGRRPSTPYSPLSWARRLSAPGLADARGWTVASWLVLHSVQFGIVSVSFQGQRWTPSAGSWQAQTPATTDVRVQLAKLVTPGPGLGRARR